IRTCPTKAYGSSSHGFAAHYAIRRRFVDKVSRLGVLALWPDDDSVTRPSLPSPGSSPAEFPDFYGTTKGSSSGHPVSPDSCARPAIPSLHWQTRETGRSLRFLGNPDGRSPCSGTPAGPRCQAVAASGRRPSARSDGGLTARSLISGLDGTAFALAVYASSGASPPSTQDSLPAARQALPGGIGYPQGSSERFLLRILLSQSIRTQERPRSAADSSAELAIRVGITCLRPTSGRSPARFAGGSMSAKKAAEKARSRSNL